MNDEELAKRVREKLNLTNDRRRREGRQTLKSLSERHRMVMRLDLMGKTNKQIANVTGFSKNTVSQIKCDPTYKKTKQAMRAELDDTFLKAAAEDVVKDPVKKMLEEAKVQAMKINIKLMKEANSENVKQRSVFDILDRAGYKPKDIMRHEGGIDLGEGIKDDISNALRDLKDVAKNKED